MPDTTLAHGVQKTAQWLLVLGFAITITVYSYKTFQNVVTDRDQMPVIYPRYIDSWNEFPRYFQKFFEDRIAWKHLQVRRYARFKLEQLHVSPTPRVWIGEDGWLFYNHEADPENYFPPTSPKFVERRKQWATALAEWNSWFVERGIQWIVVIPPNKQSIYSEFLPLIERKKVGPNPLDILLEEAKEQDPSLPLLDLRATIRQAKPTQQLYFRTDTHWNSYGALFGYRAMMHRLSLEPLPDSRIRKSVGEKVRDLPKQLGYWPEGKELFDNLDIVDSKSLRTELPQEPADQSRLNYLNTKLYVQPNSNLPTAILFHDSFGDGFFGELLAQHFSRLLCVPSNHLDPELITREKPNVVVMEIVERLFQGIGARRPTDPPRRSLNR